MSSSKSLSRSGRLQPSPPSPRRPSRTTRRRLAVALLAILAASPVAADELPLRRVVLASIGLAQFTHAGPVAGGTNIDLAVRLDQVDDLLKSLTVFDRAGGIGAVSLPGKAPLQELFRDLPFGPEALGSPSALLNALVGSEVQITGQVSATGRVFRVEPFEIRLPGDGGTVTLGAGERRGLAEQPGREAVPPLPRPGGGVLGGGWPGW